MAALLTRNVRSIAISAEWPLCRFPSNLRLTVTACKRSELVTLDAPPPPQSSEDPSSTGSLTQAAVPGAQASATAAQATASAVQAITSQPGCSHQQAAEIIGDTLQAANDPCVIYWRSLELRQRPERASYLECNGLKAYPDPQRPSHFACGVR